MAIVQYRIMLRTTGEPVPMVEDIDRDAATEWEATTRAEYPHGEVWVESRTLTPWERIEGGER